MLYAESEIHKGFPPWKSMEMYYFESEIHWEFPLENHTKYKCDTPFLFGHQILIEKIFSN